MPSERSNGWQSPRGFENSSLRYASFEADCGTYWRINYFVSNAAFYDDCDEYAIAKKMPYEQLILLDKDVSPHTYSKYAAVYQDFKMIFIMRLDRAYTWLTNYNKIIMVFPKMVPYKRNYYRVPFFFVVVTIFTRY